MTGYNISALTIINKNFLSMSEIEKKIAAFIIENPEKVINMTVHQLSTEIGVADGSIINFSNQLGFEGFTKLKINIAQNLGNKSEALYGNVEYKDSARDALKKTIDNSIISLKQTLDILSDGDLQKATDWLMNAKRIEFYGVGSSSMVAMDAYYRFMRIGLPAIAVTDSHISAVSASMLDENSVAVGISYSGRTIETLRIMEVAKAKGAKTICITSYSRSPMAKLCDISIIVASREAEIYKEAVAARISQLAVLDGICAFITAKLQNKSIEYMENLVDIIGEHRK